MIGVAGTGKSYRINAIWNLLQNKCAVTVPQVKQRIRGITVHSLLKLPIAHDQELKKT